MVVTSHKLDTADLIELAGPRLDASNAEMVKNEMYSTISQSTNRVIVDLSKIEFLDSSGLGILVGSLKQMSGGRKLELAGPTPTVQKVFKLTRMDKVFIIHDSVPSL